MFFIYALFAVLAYSLHSALMAPLYRQIEDKLSAVFYRGLCLAVSFSPALLLVPKQEFSRAVSEFPLILFASAIAVIGTWGAINSVNYLNVGVANTLLAAASNLVVLLVSVLFLSEILSTYQLILIFLIIICVIILGFSGTKVYQPPDYNPSKGIFFCSLYGVFTGSSYVFLGVISRELNPILVAYLWESLIGICAGIAIIARSIRIKQRNLISPLSFNFLLKIFICSSPAGIGSAFYALAMSQGSIAIASAILNLTMVATSAFAICFYGEKLIAKQWCFLIIICGLVTLLKF